MFAFDWPTASVVIAAIAGCVALYIAARIANNAMFERLDRLHVRVASLEQSQQGNGYRLNELERKLKPNG